MCWWGGQNAVVVLIPDCQAVYSATPLHSLYNENAIKSHPQNLSAIFCIESSLDRWVAEAHMMATLPYSQTGLTKDLKMCT